MRYQRRGFTLVELLVVAGLLAVLFGLVVGGSRSNPSSLRSAQDFASMLLAAQSRALGRPEGSAIIIQDAVDRSLLPLPDPADPAWYRGVVIHEATTLPPIVVQQLDRGVREDVAALSKQPAFPDLVFLNYDTGLEYGYKFRYRQKVGATAPIGRQVVSPWIGLRVVDLEGPNPGAWSGPTPPLKYRVGLPVRRASVGQTLSNSIFEPPGRTMNPRGVNLPNYEAVVIRQPSVGRNAKTLPSAVAIDLRYSGVGDDLAASHGYGRFNGLGPLAIVFDQNGRIADVIQKVGQRDITSIFHDLDADSHADVKYPSFNHPEWRDPLNNDPLVPNQIIYLLFAEATAIAADTSLASEKSTWVSIDPFTGRIGVSSNQPVSDGNIVNARAKARAAVAFGK